MKDLLICFGAEDNVRNRLNLAYRLKVAADIIEKDATKDNISDEELIKIETSLKNKTSNEELIKKDREILEIAKEMEVTHSRVEFYFGKDFELKDKNVRKIILDYSEKEVNGYNAPLTMYPPGHKPLDKMAPILPNKNNK